MTVSLAAGILKCFNKNVHVTLLSHSNYLHRKFGTTEGAREALSLGGTMLGFYPVRVLPSKTAILPVNPTFLPRVSSYVLLINLV